MGRVAAPHIITDDSALGGSVIERSLRFNNNDSANLTRTSSSTSNTFTYSAWIKRCKFTGYQYIFSLGGARGFAFHTNNTFYLYDGSNLNESTAVFRDSSAWYHIVVQINSGTATSYINNALVHNAVGGGAFAFTTGTNETRIGFLSPSYYYFDGYMAEVNLVDGSVLAPSSFGYTDSQTGLWRPKRYEGTYGTNGFHLEFPQSALGKDTSGNGNDFLTNNFSVSAGAGNDSLEDAPTNNYSTLNPLFKNSSSYESNGTIENGALGHSSVGSVTNAYANVTLPTVGQYYWEVRISSINSASLGIMEAGGNINRSVLYNNDGTISQDNASAQSGLGAWSNTDIIGISYYADDTTISPTSAKIQFYRNGSAQGSPLTLTTWTNPYIPFSRINAYADFNFGQRPFDYTPPTGFGKLSARDIIPVSPVIMRSQKHFDTLLYTATGNAMSVTGLEFKPDLIWQKRRDSNGGSHFHYWFDIVRGGRYILQSNTNAGDSDAGSDSNIVFKEGGFDMAATDGGQGNGTGGTYAAWCWKAGGAAVTNTVGNISAQVSANDEAGFSIITYTGDGNSSGNVGTGLRSTQPLDMVIVKRRDSTSDWQVGHRASGQVSNFAYHFNLNDTSVLSGSSPYHMGSQSATNGDRLYLAAGGLTSSATYVAYVWQERSGYSKFGSYVGSGNADGPFIHLGFKPAWVMIKEVDDANNWIIMDNKRGAFNDDLGWLYADLGYLEESGSGRKCDFLSNGFKIRSPGTGINSSGDTYIYMAFAEAPGITPYDTQTNAR